MFTRKKSLLLLFAVIGTAVLWCGSSYDEGVEAYRLSQYDKAEALLKTALQEEPAEDKIHLLLAAVYQKQNRFDMAESTLVRGMELSGANRDNLAFNLANLYYSQAKKEDAVTLYTDLVQGFSSYRAGATLNRANCYLSLGDYPMALSDYGTYLTLEPTTPQRTEIERMMALLTARIVEEEERIRLAAQQEALDEQRKLEEEKRAADEAAAQQALLDEILASLEGVSDETQVISAGTENIVIDDEDSDIEE